MTPAQAIAALDRQIAQHGQTVKFFRGSASLTAKAFVRGFKPADLVGSIIKQGDRQIVLSPSSLGAFGIPRNLDQGNVGGKPLTVTAVEEVHMNDVLVRLNIMVSVT